MVKCKLTLTGDSKTNLSYYFIPLVEPQSWRKPYSIGNLSGRHILVLLRECGCVNDCPGNIVIMTFYCSFFMMIIMSYNLLINPIK